LRCCPPAFISAGRAPRLRLATCYSSRALGACRVARSAQRASVLADARRLPRARSARSARLLRFSTEPHGRRPARRRLRAAAAPLLRCLALLAAASCAATPAPPRRAALGAPRRLAQAPLPLPQCDGETWIEAENLPARPFQISPSSLQVPVPWTTSFRLPDYSVYDNSDYFYFTVPDTFTVITVTAALTNFRHFRANDVVLTLQAPNNGYEVYLVNRPCRASAAQPSTFGAAAVSAWPQVNATSAGDTYYWGDWAFNPPGSIQGSQCPNNQFGVNPIAGGVSTYGYYQPMDPQFPGYQGTVVNGVTLGNRPDTMTRLAGGSAQGVWRMRYTDMATPCAWPAAL
jgi:hypothetical protein